MPGEWIAGLGQQNAEALLLGLAAGMVVLVITSVWLALRVRRLSRGYARLVAGSDGESLERTLFDHLDRVARAEALAAEASTAGRELGRRVDGCLQRIGFVRFDAFEDVGGMFSFALALMDDTGSGIVFSSLHGRHDTRFFVKRVENGKSAVALTAEEAEALRQAGG